MAEESDLEKTEPASERRLEKAREEGNVARSRELTTLVMLGTAIGGLWFTAQSLGSTMSAALRRGLHFERAAAFEPSHMMAQTGFMALQTLMAIAPFFAMMVVAAVVAPLMLVSWSPCLNACAAALFGARYATAIAPSRSSNQTPLRQPSCSC